MSHRCGCLCAQRADSVVPMRTAMLVRAVVHVQTGRPFGWWDWPPVRVVGLAARSGGGTGRPFGWRDWRPVRVAGTGGPFGWRDWPHFSGPECTYARPRGPGGHSPGNSCGCADISAFPAASLAADPSTPPRRPGALVTSRQDLLITVRAVITTVRLCPGLVDGTVVRIRLSRWYFAFSKYLVTCDVRAWQLNSKVSVPFGHKNRTKHESGECSNSGLAAGLR